MNTSASVLPETSWHSCLYECRVRHHRLAPRRHRFEYGIFLLCVDLDELPALHRGLRLFSRNRPNLYEFRDRDHLEYLGPGAAADLKSSVRAWLAAQGVAAPADARFRLVTLPRVAGYVFNPVSFYFVHTASGLPICAVTQVGNTFGELKPYLVPFEGGDGPGSTAGTAERFRRVVPKHFYVSPFSGLDVCFDFNLRNPGERLEISVNDVTADGQTLLVTTLVGARRSLTDGQLLRLTAKYPLVTVRVIMLIHWQALRLWWKGLPWHRKAAAAHLQREVFRPHASLLDLPAEGVDADHPIASPTISRI